MRIVQWLGTSRKSVAGFPESARREAGYQLDRVQRGKEPKDWKPMRAIGPGVRELRVHADGEHRVIYLAKFEEAVYVLHAFTKKTQKAPKLDVEVAAARYRALMLKRNPA
ncbi:MAG: type II toxin-antitoxin system RelE/ParE family toxin [Burkholderiales bacterium]